MKYKEDSQERQFEVWLFAMWLDTASRMAGYGEITITSALRIGDLKYHGKGQALDIRTHDKPPEFYDFMEECGKVIRKRTKRFQMDLHPALRGTPNAHIHIEIDDDSLS